MRHRTAWWWTIRLSACLMTLSAASCATDGHVANSCAGWMPIRISHEDSLSAETAREILQHDKHGADVCGWSKAK